MGVLYFGRKFRQGRKKETMLPGPFRRGAAGIGMGNGDTESMQAKKIIVHGKVQGVGFRYFVQHAAGNLGLVGNVRNCPDRTVEIEVEGKDGDIEKFIEQVRQGPPLSWVHRVDVIDMRATGSYDSFLIEGW
jgi:acylphosphatase